MRGGCKPIRQSDGPVLDRPVFISGLPLLFFFLSSFPRLRAPERARTAKLARRASIRMMRVKRESSSCSCAIKCKASTRLRRACYFCHAAKVTKNAFRADSRGTAAQGRCVGLEISVYYSVEQNGNVTRFACTLEKRSPGMDGVRNAFGVVRGAEHRRLRRRGPQGARTMRARRLSAHGRAVRRPRRSREAQGIPIRGCESEHRGRCTYAFLVTFAAWQK